MKAFLTTTTLAALLLVSATAQANFGIVRSRYWVNPQLEIGSHPHAAPKDGSGLLYYGGPVISSVKLYTVYWGASIDKTLMAGLPDFYKAIVTSNQIDTLAQYDTTGKAVDFRAGTNQHIGYGTYQGEITITPKNSSKNLDDTDVQAELDYQIGQNILPRPDENTLFVIHFPAGVGITIQGQASCSAFCAYHDTYKSTQFGNVFYGVIPDVGSGMCAFGCSMGASVLDSTTFVTSHEIFEAITDPFPTPGSSPAYPQAWNSSGGDEVADLCQQSTTMAASSKSITVTQLWDNSIGRCNSSAFQSK